MGMCVVVLKIACISIMEILWGSQGELSCKFVLKCFVQ